MSLVIRPCLSHKGLSQQANGRFSLIVERTANKLEIAKEVARLFGVTVLGVRTARYHGKKKSRLLQGRWVVGQRAAYKKAVITVRPGESIDWQ